jgi:hypothetical protein
VVSVDGAAAAHGGANKKKKEKKEKLSCSLIVAPAHHAF